MSINQLLNQTITVKIPTGSHDVHGKPALGAEVEYRARIERTYKTIITPNKDREPVHAVGFVGPDSNIPIGSQVVYGSDTYRVLQRSDVVGRRGRLHHNELMLQLWSFE
jgi:hypothetical protein